MASGSCTRDGRQEGLEKGIHQLSQSRRSPYEYLSRVLVSCAGDRRLGSSCQFRILSPSICDPTRRTAMTALSSTSLSGTSVTATSAKHHELPTTRLSLYYLAGYTLPVGLAL